MIKSGSHDQIDHIIYVVVICNVIHTQVDVVSDDQREKMKAMTLDKR